VSKYRLRIQHCTEPDDRNCGGYDILVQDGRGLWACVAEVTTYDRAVNILADPPPHLQSLCDEYVALKPGEAQS
jgi:hypothetical protein